MAQNTGYNYPSANSVITTGDVAFSNLGNLYANDNNVASVTLNNGQTSDTVRVTGFNFASDNIPSTAKVVGIAFYMYASTGAGNTMNVTANLYDAGNGVSSNSDNYSYTNTTESGGYFGGSSGYTTIWGDNPPSITNLEASTWGIQFNVTNNSGATETLNIDYVMCIVYYFVPPAIEGTQTTTPTTGTSHVMSAPASIASGETLLLLVASDSTSTASRQQISLSGVGSTEWEKIFEHGHTASNCRIAGFVKRRADGTEGSVTVATTTSCSTIGHYMRISGTWSGFAPIERVGFPEYVSAAGGSANTPPAPVFTSTNDFGMAIGFYAADGDHGGVAVSGTDWTEDTEATSGGTVVLSTCLAHRINNDTTTGVDPTFTPTNSQSSLGIVLNIHAKDAQQYAGSFVYPQHYRKAKITIDPANIGSTLTDFPILITENDLPPQALDTNASYEIYDSSARDVFFSSDPEGENILPHDVVSCVKNAVTASRQFQCWVLVPSISSSVETNIYMWWRSTITYDYGTWHQSMVWKDYIFVCHLGGYDDNAPTIADDSSPYQRPFAQTGSVSLVNNAWGHSSGALNYLGTDDYMRHEPHELGFDFQSGTWTLQAWAKPDVDSAASEFIACVQNPSTAYGGSIGGFALMISSDGYYGVCGGSTPWTSNRKSTVEALAANWNLVHAEYANGATSRVYVDGTSYAGSHTQSWAVSTQNDAFTFAANSYVSGPIFDYDGSAHEIRLREGSLGTDWIAAEYANQKNDGTFLTIEMMSNACWEQEGFRWRNDDGSESGATWMDSQDTNVTGPRNVNKRLRFVIDNLAPNVNPLQMKLKLQYRRVGDTLWKDMD